MEIKLPFLKEEIGAGDVVKAATGAVGIQPCTPCEERRKRMNGALRFVPQRASPPQWTKPPEVPEGWTRESTCDGTGVRLERFIHQDGRLIFWRVIDGEYRNSHTFCCGEQMRGMALAKWEELCRSL